MSMWPNNRNRNKSFYNRLVVFFIATFISVLSVLNSPSQQAEAASFLSYYFYANTRLADVPSGWGFTVAFEPATNIPAGGTYTITFPDDEDGMWCRAGGILSVFGVTSTPVDIGGTGWAIDAALPGSIAAVCTTGSGVGSHDTITIVNIDALSSAVTYGFEIAGNVGVLGTADRLGGHLVQMEMRSGAIFDNVEFLVTLSDEHSTVISATVLPLPECTLNTDCQYPLEICDGLRQCVPCTVDGQCSSGDLCQAGRCVRDLSCANNNDCFYGDEVCVNNLCQPCDNDYQCNTGDRCQNSVCEPIPPAQCTVNSHCNYPYGICDQYNQCVPCTNDSQCSGEDTCEDAVCTAPPPTQCSTNGQCNYPNEICNNSGYCSPCITDWQCEYDDVCVDNVCTGKFKCEDNDDCRFPDEICTNNNDCEPCTLDQECGEGNTCEDGLCEAIPPAECTNNDQCNYPDEVCPEEQICRACRQDFECNEGDVCISGRCEAVPPAECSDNGQCDYPDEVCSVDNLCVQCVNDDECDFGDECRDGTCVAEEDPDSLIPVISLDFFDDLVTAFSDNITAMADQINSLSFNGAIATTVSLVTSIGLGMTLLNLALMDTPVLFTRGVLGLMTLLGIRLKGQPYGFVYNSVTKDPLSNAMVRIFTSPKAADERRRLVATSVTDAFGVFDAKLDPGRYTINASKSGFRFPSRIVVSVSDYPIDKVYHGDPFDLQTEGEIYYSIPIDPFKQGILRTFTAIIRDRFGIFARFLQITFMAFGAFLSVYLFITNPTVVNTVLLLLYVPGILFTVYSVRNKPPRFGTVKDTEGNPMKELTLGLYDETEKRMITKRVSDEMGRFRFVAPEGEYHIEVMNAPYEVVNEDEIYLRSNKSADLIVIASDVVVQRKEVEDVPLSDKNEKDDKKDKDKKDEKEEKEDDKPDEGGEDSKDKSSDGFVSSPKERF